MNMPIAQIERWVTMIVVEFDHIDKSTNTSVASALVPSAVLPITTNVIRIVIKINTDPDATVYHLVTSHVFFL